MEWFTNADYWLSRLVFQRGLAVLYGVAFVSSALQFRALIGERGLLPVPRFLASVPFRRAPSIFQWYYSDRFFALVAWTGAALSAAVAAGAADLVPLWAAMLMWATLWALYLSIVNAGQTWYAFMWEMLRARTAGGLMSTPAVTVPAEAALPEAARLMTQRGIERLPVVDEEDRLVGIVTRRDLLQVFLRSDEEIRQAVQREVVAGALWLSPHIAEVAVYDGVVTHGTAGAAQRHGRRGRPDTPAGRGRRRRGPPHLPLRRQARTARRRSGRARRGRRLAAPPARARLPMA